MGVVAGCTATGDGLILSCVFACLQRRWVNHLRPDVVKGAWTAEEDRVVMEGLRELGKLVSKCK